jgi:predicted PurR-regulated permease PerM
MLSLIWVSLVISLVVLFHNLATLLGISILFTYLLLPLVNSLEQGLIWLLKAPVARRRFRVPKALIGASVPLLSPRLLAVVVIYVLLGLMVAIVLTIALPIVSAQADDLFQSIPRYCQQIRHHLRVIIPAVPELPFTEATWPQWVNHQASQWIASGAGPLALSRASEWSAHGLRGVVYLLSGISIVFYLLLDGQSRAEGLMPYLPSDRWRATWQDCHAVLFRFVKGQVLLAFISGLLMFTLYSVFQVPHALVLSLVFTVAEIFPVIGPWFAFTPGIVVMLLGENPWVTAYVLGIYFLLKDNIILPKVVGEVMGIHPVWIILAILIAAKLAGAIGVIFAVPLAAILHVFWQHWFQHADSATLLPSRDAA